MLRPGFTVMPSTVPSPVRGGLGWGYEAPYPCTLVTETAQRAVLDTPSWPPPSLGEGQLVDHVGMTSGRVANEVGASLAAPGICDHGRMSGW